ncbi:MAG: PD-(D/E)XK nuclease family protein [Candidatus Gastranaerophilales bacterium]
MLNNYSPNMLKTFEKCPKQYWYKYVRKISIPQKSSYFEKGKKIHALAHYYLRGDDISKLELALSEQEKQLWGSLIENEYFNKTYLNSEYNLACKVEQNWVSGRLDALMRSDEDYFILDYKTGSIPKTPEFDPQTMIYLLCVDKFLKNYNSLKFVYIDLKNNENHITEFDDDKRVEYENRVSRICKTLENFNFDLEFEHCKKCDFCEYNKICI